MFPKIVVPDKSVFGLFQAFTAAVTGIREAN
jgi:hypothetical protein